MCASELRLHQHNHTQHSFFVVRVCMRYVDVLCSSLCSCIACSYLCCSEWCERVVCPGVHGGRVAGFRHRIGFAGPGKARAKARLLVLLFRCCVHSIDVLCSSSCCPGVACIVLMCLVVVYYIDVPCCLGVGVH